MAEIVNLRRVRKNKARAEKDKAAETNRMTHGVPKTARKLAAAKTEKSARDLQGKKLDKLDK